MKTKTLLLTLLVLLLSLAACTPTGGNAGGEASTVTPTETPTTPPTETPPQQPTELTEALLKNMSIQGVYDVPVKLTDGLYEGEPFVAGGASKPTVTLLPLTAFGDLNGDDINDAAVLLIESSGGSGSFVYLAAVLNNDGTAENAATILLGDRVSPESIDIVAGEIILETAAHAEDDPMCCPSLKTRLTYALQNGELTIINTEALAESISDKETAIANDLLGTWYWTAYQYTAELNDITISDPTKYTLEIAADGTVQIQADCNSAGSQVTIEGSKLTFSPGPMTLAECEPGSLYGEYLAKLGDVASYVIDDAGNLILTLNMGAGSMTFARTAEAGSQLEGTSWILSSILAAQAAETSEIDAEITALFQDGQMAGYAGCNNYFTSYEVNGSALALGPVGSTRMACDEARNQREMEFLTALASVAGYDLADDTLELVDADGNVLILFTALAETAVPDQLLGVWYWLAYQDMAELNDIVVTDPTRYTVEFLADGTAQIKADCNQAIMSYELRQGGLNGSLLATPGPMTLAECGSDSHYLTFINSLEAAQDYRVTPSGKQMVLFLPADGGVLTFAAAP